MSEQLESVASIVERHGFHEHELMSILQEIQRTRNWLPPEDLKTVARLLGVTRSRVYSIATFYKAFSLKPRGKHIVHVCLGTACHVRGAERIVGAVERELGIQGGETDKDLLWTLETVGCLGACALGPIVVVDGEYHGQMTSVKASRLLKRIKKADGNGAGEQ